MPSGADHIHAERVRVSVYTFSNALIHHHCCMCMYTCRFRLIPGDLCESTEESEKVLKPVEKVCTGHEKDAGFYPENRHGGVSPY